MAVAAYVACGISGGHPMRTAVIAMRLGVVKYVIPFLFVYNPSLLLQGSAGQIAITVITGIIGVSILSIGLEGYCLRQLNWAERPLFIIGGFLSLWPFHRLPALTVAGVVVSCLVLLWHRRSAQGTTLTAVESG